MIKIGFTKDLNVWIFLCGLMLLIPSGNLFAEGQAESLKVMDALCCYAYNPESPDGVIPLFIGDTIPKNWHVYLPDSTSTVTLTKDEGEDSEVVMEQPGVYDTGGKIVKPLSTVMKILRQKGKSCQMAKFYAEGMVREAKSYTGPLELDDPQRVPSPSD